MIDKLCFMNTNVIFSILKLDYDGKLSCVKIINNNNLIVAIITLTVCSFYRDLS